MSRRSIDPDDEGDQRDRIRSAQIVLFYLVVVAETIELQPIPDLIGGPTVATRKPPQIHDAPE